QGADLHDPRVRLANHLAHAAQESHARLGPGEEKVDEGSAAQRTGDRLLGGDDIGRARHAVDRRELAEAAARADLVEDDEALAGIVEVDDMGAARNDEMDVIGFALAVEDLLAARPASPDAVTFELLARLGVERVQKADAGKTAAQLAATAAPLASGCHGASLG